VNVAELLKVINKEKIFSLKTIIIRRIIIFLKKRFKKKIKKKMYLPIKFNV